MAPRKKKQPEDALPENDDQTNIGARNTSEAAGQELDEDPIPEEREPVASPVPQSGDDYEPEVRGEQWDPSPAVNTDEDLITVTGTYAENRIVIAEVNPRHPDGQLVIKGTQSKQAAKTRRVMSAISDGILTQE